MAFKAKYKQHLRSSAGRTADGGGGGHGAAGATPQNSPRQGPLPSPRRSPSPLDVECKMPRYNEHCNHDYHNSDTSSRTKLYVGSISTDAREQDLEAAFSIYGRVQRVFLHPDNYGFVVFYEPQDADAARCHLNGKEFFGSRISVEFAKEHKIPRYDNHRDHDHYGQQGGNTKLFVGNISRDIQEYHIEGLFSIYGRVRNVYLKQKFAFVEFYDPHDAYNARRELDGEEFGWSLIFVEFATGVESGPGGPAPIRRYNCGTYGHQSHDSKAGDWKDRSYPCGESGHISKNYRNSHNDLGREYRAGGEELQSGSPRYCRSPRSPLPRPRKKAKHSGSCHDDNRHPISNG